MIEKQDLEKIIVLPDLSRFNLSGQELIDAQAVIRKIKSNQIHSLFHKILAVIEPVLERDEGASRLKCVILESMSLDYASKFIFRTKLCEGIIDDDIANQLEESGSRYKDQESLLLELRHQFFLDKKPHALQAMHTQLLAISHSGVSKYFTEGSLNEDELAVLSKLYHNGNFKNSVEKRNAHQDITLTLFEIQSVIVSIINAFQTTNFYQEGMRLFPLPEHQLELLAAYTQSSLFQLIENNNIKQFAQHLIDPDAINFHTGQSLLQFAVLKQKEDIVNLLLARGANVMYENYEKLTALHYAAEGKNRAVFDLILSASHDVDAKDVKGLTPLHIAAEMNRVYNIKMLLGRGANPNLQTQNHSVTPAHLAIKHHSMGAIRELLSCSSIDLHIQDKWQHSVSDLISKDPIVKDEAVFRPLKNNFLNVLITIANDCNNKDSRSFLKWLPIEIIFYIISYLDFASMNKSLEEGCHLAAFIFNNYPELKKMSGSPGGINIFQESSADPKKISFRFFKSPWALSNDFQKATQQELNKKRKVILSEEEAETETTGSFPLLSKVIQKESIDIFQNYASFYKPKSKPQAVSFYEDSDLYWGVDLSGQSVKLIP